MSCITKWHEIRVPAYSCEYKTALVETATSMMKWTDASYSKESPSTTGRTQDDGSFQVWGLGIGYRLPSAVQHNITLTSELKQSVCIIRRSLKGEKKSKTVLMIPPATSGLVSDVSQL